MKRPLIFYICCEFLPFNLWRCGRLIFFRLLFAGANNCLWLISDFENKFSVVICQTQQSTIATVSLGLLKPAEVVSRSCCWKSFPFSLNSLNSLNSLSLAPPPSLLGLLSASAAVSRRIGILFLFIRNEFRGSRALRNALLFFCSFFNDI